jgi:glycine cleavage system H protein
MNVPKELNYTTDHEWLKVDGNFGYVGITDYAQSELGDIVFIDVDPDLDEVVKDEPFGTIEAVKTVSDLLAPVSGKVVELNPKLEDEPQLVNTDPYGEGWIIKIEIEDLESVNTLLSAEDYAKQIGG